MLVKLLPLPVAPTLSNLTPAQLDHAAKLKAAGSVLEGDALAAAASKQRQFQLPQEVEVC